MRMQRFRTTGALGGLAAGMPDHFRGDGIVGSVPYASGKQPDGWFAAQTAIVFSQVFQQIRAKRDISILASLAFLNMDHHALAVDVRHLQMCQFGSPYSGVPYTVIRMVRWNGVSADSIKEPTSSWLKMTGRCNRRLG